MRAKFHVESVTNFSGGAIGVVLTPVKQGSEDKDNENFWKYTPNGKLEMTITNPNAQGFFNPGNNYYLDFTPCQISE